MRTSVKYVDLSQRMQDGVPREQSGLACAAVGKVLDQMDFFCLVCYREGEMVL